MRRPNGSVSVWGDEGEFVGFIPDLMRILSRRVGFNYEIRLVTDGKYGGRNVDGSWNGMIGELMNRVR